MTDSEKAQRTAARLSDYAVLAHDPAAPAVALEHWTRTEPHVRRVGGWLANLCLGRSPAWSAYRALVDSPADPQRHRTLATAVAAVLVAVPGRLAEVLDLLGTADRRIWLDHHLGADYRPDAGDLPLSALVSRLAAGRAAPARDVLTADAHVVIPFGDRTGGGRTRKLSPSWRRTRHHAGGN
jgi:hypothetical protein